MKILISALLISSSVFASEEVLLTCTNTAFNDLQEIVLTTDSHGEMVVTERSSDGTMTSYKRDLKQFVSTRSVELSGWNGYTRTLLSSGGEWGIEARDECSGSYSAVDCK